MPDPIQLDMPPEDAAELDALVSEVAGAAVCLAAVDDRLIGAAAAAPGWLGDDAAAAAAQVTEIAALVRAASEAVLPAIGRVSSHTERLREIRGQVTALRTEQDEQFAEAWRRWYQLPDLRAQLGIDGPAVRAIVHDLEAGEASRRRRHAALLEELADDAAATARVLADSLATVGGRGAPGDRNRVVAHLATHLPGWGDHELARRGSALAEDLINDMSTATREEFASGAFPFAGSAAFADAFLAALGPVWMRDVLQALGEGDLGPGSALARLVAAAFGAAARGGVTGPAAEVLEAEYTSPDDPTALDDYAVLGMGAVLVASRTLGPQGMVAPTVAAWGRQIALRERVVGAAAIDRVNPLDDAAPPVDALAAVVAILGSGTEPGAAAAFLDGPWVWSVLLARSWEDCGTSLRGLVASAGSVEGGAGEAVVREGLQSLGARLEDGDAHDWPVDRGAANAVSPALAEALAGHISVAGEVLVSGAAGGLPVEDGALLRGLGYVTLDRASAGVIEGALGEWVAAQPVPAWVTGPPPLLPAVVVPNAYLAVQEYGQQLAHALGEIDREEEAQDRAFLWNMTVGLAADLAPGPWGIAAGIIADYVAMGLHLDGTWDGSSHPGLEFAPEVPTTEEMAHLTPEDWTVVDRMARMAQSSFDGVQQSLGTLMVPKSPETHWWGPLRDALKPGPSDVAGPLMRRRVPDTSPVR